jgi:hypothetical protein
MPAPVGTLARVAVLTDASPSNAALWVSEYMRQNSLFMWNEGIAGTTINQLDPVTATLTPSVTYLPGRGVFLPAEENFLLTDGTAPSIPPLLPAASQINFE